MRATSPGSFTRRNVLDEVLGRHELVPANASAQARCWAQVTPCASSPRRANGADERRRIARLGCRRVDDLDAGVDAGRVELLARLRLVAAVGDEHELRRARRAASRPTR